MSALAAFANSGSEPTTSPLRSTARARFICIPASAGFRARPSFNSAAASLGRPRLSSTEPSAACPSGIFGSSRTTSEKERRAASRSPELAASYPARNAALARDALSSRATLWACVAACCGAVARTAGALPRRAAATTRILRERDGPEGEIAPSLMAWTASACSPPGFRSPSLSLALRLRCARPRDMPVPRGYAS